MPTPWCMGEGMKERERSGRKGGVLGDDIATSQEMAGYEC
jgi:hypothetical protein